MGIILVYLKRHVLYICPDVAKVDSAQDPCRSVNVCFLESSYTVGVCVHIRRGAVACAVKTLTGLKPEWRVSDFDDRGLKVAAIIK
jgi:hypothetical protein